MAKVSYEQTSNDAPKFATILGIDFTAGGDSVDVPEGPKLEKFRAWQTHHPEIGITVAETPAAPAASNGGLQAVHRGRGVYAVVEDGVVLDALGPMTRSDADAFNALTDDEKQAFVDKPADTSTGASATGQAGITANSTAASNN